MKYLSSAPAHKLILWICFIPAIAFVVLYELYLTDIPSSSETNYRIGVITSKIGYSIAAASIFYFISQYIPIYRPRQKKKIKILPYIHDQTLNIDYQMNRIKLGLNIHGEEFKKNDIFKKAVNDVKVDLPIDQFENWHQFLFDIKFQILDTIRSLYFYNDFLSLEYLHELILIEKNIKKSSVFDGYKTLECTNLSYGEITLQELLIHNQHLQDLREKESKKYEKEFKKAGNEYRIKYYRDNNSK